MSHIFHASGVTPSAVSVQPPTVVSVYSGDLSRVALQCTQEAENPEKVMPCNVGARSFHKVSVWSHADSQTIQLHRRKDYFFRRTKVKALQAPMWLGRQSAAVGDSALPLCYLMASNGFQKELLILQAFLFTLTVALLLLS